MVRPTFRDAEEAPAAASTGGACFAQRSRGCHLREGDTCSSTSTARRTYVLPWIYRSIDVVVPGDPGYADTIVSQGGHRLVAVDELLDYGLVLDWDNRIRFAVPLDGTGLQGVEAAVFTGKKGEHIWTPADPAVARSPPPRSAVEWVTFVAEPTDAATIAPTIRGERLTCPGGVSRLQAVGNRMGGR